MVTYKAHDFIIDSSNLSTALYLTYMQAYMKDKVIEI